MSRAELDDYARDQGIDPEGYSNADALRDAIRAKEENVADDDTTPDEQDTTSSAGDDAGQAEVQARFDKEQEQGYVGRKVDPLPNTAYSLEGGAPEVGDNPTTPSDEDVKADPTRGDQYEGGASYTDPNA